MIPPLEGASIAATFAHADAPAARLTQYFELHGNRAIWHDGWKAVAIHQPEMDFENDCWELYNLSQDFSESTNLAVRQPERLKELQRLWWREAGKYGVLPLNSWNPLDPRSVPRKISAARSEVKSYTYYPGQEHLPRGVVPSTKNRSYSITAFVNRPDERAEGVLVALGEYNGGFVLYLKDGKLVFDYNDLGTHTVLTSDAKVPIGKATLHYEFTKTGDWKGTGTLFINDRKAAENTLSQKPSLLLSWEGLDVGRDALSPVTSVYAKRGEFAFTPGALEKVVIKVELSSPNPQSAQSRVAR